MEPVVCIVGAIKEEIAVIKGGMNVEETARLDYGSLWIGTWRGRRIALVRSGIGQIRARRSLEQARERLTLSLVVSMGFAGGLDPRLEVGDLIVADKVLAMPTGSPDTGPEPREISLRSPCAEQAMALADSADGKVYAGGLLTVNEIVYTPERKRALGERYPVLAAEMETHALADLSAEKRIPFLAVRSITDTADHELMNFSPMQNDRGEVSPLKAGWYVLTHPGKAKDMVQLRAHSQKASARLTRFVARFIESLG
ncbi:MAG: hypothetical protein HZA02_05350 [Nitrospinae bacterium]|nr:hypothetical protein [Nitrospinota bacterium]